MTVEHWIALVVGLAALLQLAAALSSVRLVSASGATAGPVALGVALALMASRRIVSFTAAASGLDPAQWLLPHEVIGLIASALVWLAVGRLSEVFRSRRRDEEELLRSHEQLGQIEARERLLSEQCIHAHEQERRLLSYEVHDGLAQYVVAAQMHLETYMAYVDRDTAKADYELGAVNARLASAVNEVRRLVSELRLSVLEDLGLAAAVQEHLLTLAEANGWTWEVHDDLQEERLDSQVETMAFRIIQEALTNAAKHARTRRVEVGLALEEGELCATVRDWGRGFDVQQALADAHTLGLTAMEGRARLIRGHCAIESRPGAGTTVRLRAPAEPPGEEE